MATDGRYPNTPLADIETGDVKTVSEHKRPAKVGLEQLCGIAVRGSTMDRWLKTLSQTLGVNSIMEAANAIRTARETP